MNSTSPSNLNASQEKRIPAMSIFKQAHVRQYAVVSNTLAQNPNLTLRAKGLMLYFLSLPDNWEVRTAQLVSVMLEGRDVILRTIKELKEEGYVHEVKVGYPGKLKYFVFETPPSESELEEILQRNGFSGSQETSECVVSAVQKTHSTDINKQERYKDPTPPYPKERPLKKKYRENVSLTEEEFAKLVKAHGEDKLSILMDRLDAYCGSKGKRYKSDYHVLSPAGWVNRTMEEEKKRAAGFYHIGSVQSPRPTQPDRPRAFDHLLDCKTAKERNEYEMRRMAKWLAEKGLDLEGNPLKKPEETAIETTEAKSER